ncbi:MAG: rhamnan synthesis F family protein [Streptococcaceae bacterium]|jgi:rhamnosyltransferase|nr:rhamnan synthesis F family protein [Streptococcaceae bacterium]
MNRLLLYVHFNKFNQVSDHVVYQLSRLRPLFSNVIFISNSELSDEDCTRLSNLKLYDDLIQRQNEGFDFAAWRDGMTFVGFDHLSDYDSVTLMNDTCFGPLYDLAPYYEKYEADRSIDFWGITNHVAHEKYPEHIQSYFMSFKNEVLQSRNFQDFWKKVKSFTDVQDVIDHYETQNTEILMQAGFKGQTILDTTLLDATQMTYPDFSFWNPTAIVQNKVPFIKVKAIAAHQAITPYVLDYIRKNTDYPIELITGHMSMIDLPDYPYLLSEKFIDKTCQYTGVSERVAVHFHVFYVDLVADFLAEFLKFEFNYDLLITTDTIAKKEEIQTILSAEKMTAEIFVTGNIGRDIYPMLKIKDKISQYDIIGHFHTKKSKEADFFAGESWRNELIDMLIKPANSLIQNLVDDKNLGVIIADIPTFFRFNKIVNANNEASMAPIMNELWHKMNFKKEIDFSQMDTFTMSYGTFVWFKYQAYQSLFDLEIKDTDIPKEPLPQNTILHAIERLFIYIAWEHNYDFKISQNEIKMTAFVDNKVLNTKMGFPNEQMGLKKSFRYIFSRFKLEIKKIFSIFKGR